MAHSTTTAEVITNNAELKVYETLEIKRRFVAGFEASWFDITSFLLDTNAINISQKLDFESFGYGQFKTGSAVFKLNNLQGTFNNENDIYSVFSTTISRHYTKVRYSAGYRDEDGDKINEVAFEGLINGKMIENNFNDGTIKFTVLGTEQILTERTIAAGTITTTLASDIIGEIFAGDSTITDFINFSAGDINPGNDITFDDGSKFEKKKVSTVLNDIAKKTNSVWFVDSSLDIIFKAKTINANTPFEFIGGSRKSRAVNILSIEFIDDGFTKIINEVRYTSGSTITVTQSVTADNLEKFGTNTLELAGEDLTTGGTIGALSAAIIADNETPKQRIILTTVYMPNVIAFLDKCTIDYRPAVVSFGRKLLVFNDGVSTFNTDFFFGAFANRNIILPATIFKYLGFSHNIVQGQTKHFLIAN